MLDSEGGRRWWRAGSHPVLCAAVPRWATVDGTSVKVVAYFPSLASTRPLPVVVFCHGLGGSAAGYSSLGRHLASHGYVVLHPEFLDAALNAASTLGVPAFDERALIDDPALRASMRFMLFDPAYWVDRVRRVHAVLDSLATQRHLPVQMLADQVVLGGHSFGAYTTQLLMGVRLASDVDDSAFKHSAVAAGVLLSPQGSGDRGLTARSWDEIDIPLLVVTGTQDWGPNGEGLSWRSEPYYAAPTRKKYLAVARNGTHLLGDLPSADAPMAAGTDGDLRQAIAALVVAFCDGTRGDRAAEDWLDEGPLPAIFEHATEGAKP